MRVSWQSNRFFMVNQTPMTIGQIQNTAMPTTMVTSKFFENQPKKHAAIAPAKWAFFMPIYRPLALGIKMAGAMMAVNTAAGT